MGSCFFLGPSLSEAELINKRLIKIKTYHISGNLDLCGLSRFVELCRYVLSSRNDHHYKNRIAILYNETCCTVPHLFPEQILLVITGIIEPWPERQPEELRPECQPD